MRPVVIFLFCFLFGFSFGQTQSIWWEAEKPYQSNFPPLNQNPFGPFNPQEVEILSGGSWIGVSGNYTEPLFLEYRVEVAQAGTYQLYCRKFWKHGPFRWRFENQAWQTCSKEVALLDEAPLRQYVVANWVSLGEVKLPKGNLLFRVELLNEEGAAAFDAFLLTQLPFTPRGKKKPGEKWDRAPEGWFPFEPDADVFGKSPIDLRFLNEKFAGEQGSIQVKGERFVHQKNGKTVRFWAVNGGEEILRMPDSSLKQLARFLSKKGVNLLRCHLPFYQKGKPYEVDRELINRLHSLIFVLKEEGIYTSLSIYFPLWMPADRYFSGYGEGQFPFGLIFFQPELQKWYQNWWKALLKSKNPHTRKSLIREPALAFVELVNEDSLFFWTFSPYKNIPASQMSYIESLFAQWLTKRYGTLSEGFKAWGGSRVEGDEPKENRVGILDLYQIFTTKTLRAQDTAAFLTELQKNFYKENIQYLREKLKYQGLICCSNWITANASILGPLEKYSYLEGDFLDRHGYMDSFHDGPHASYSLNQGDVYQNRSALKFEPREGDEISFELPIMDITYNQRPSIISEINWPAPNRFRADMPLLCAAYGLLQGTDGFFFFALRSESWQQTLTKFPIQTPVVFGQFPATALLYRQGLLSQGEPVVKASLSVSDMFRLEGAPVKRAQNLEALRAINRVEEHPSETVMDFRAHLVGAVQVDLGTKDSNFVQTKLSDFILAEEKQIKSNTGELLWDYERGVLQVHSEKVWGGSGFLRPGIEFGKTKLTTDMEYGTLLWVALDHLPLSQSKKMLLQVMTEEKNYGWETIGEGPLRIENLGSVPLVVKNFQGKLEGKLIESFGEFQVTPLDFNGYPKSKATKQKGKILFESPTIYYLIERP